MGNAWWKECVFYQIYPRSFQDSNGDGIGDLQGIISRLDYLKWLGVGAVWLCPVYDSPNADMGYDIRDYEKIMAEIGTMSDFEQLIEEMHKRNLKLVMDLVVNHSSNEHKWFLNSRKSKDNPYRSYYIWRDGKNGQEPNNWASFFLPSAWTRDAETDQWYLHLFSEQQPDLNWENPALRDEIYCMINRWLDRGVDGFRMDAITMLGKEPGLPDGEGEGYTFPFQYFSFQPQLHTYLREMREKCFDGRDCMCVGETTFVTPENANSLVGDGRELDLLFTFDMMDMDSGKTKWDPVPFDLQKMRNIIQKWQDAIDWNTLFWGNHDQPRIVSRFGSTVTEKERVSSAQMLATAMYLLRGTPFIYQGEEIGMTNFPFADESQLRDLESVNCIRRAKMENKIKWAWTGIRKKGRDNARTPMQWTDGSQAGFTDGTPWIDVNPNYPFVNVRKDAADPKSILSYYRNLIRLRNENNALKFGDFQMLLPDHSQVFAYMRSYNGEKIGVFCNFSDYPAYLAETFDTTVLLSEGYEDAVLAPYGAVVIQFA